ncbi:MAG: biopolymer transporter ExbD [Deltaproteobacteria bacterium]|nr:MAG: biopolymer transporter ExbD [Deltaproteobacteria bacterium]
MGMSGGGKYGDLNSEINVTPLVDVMLVLLIIFMVTAPMLNAAVDLNLPQGGVTKVADTDGKLVLSIDKHRVLRLGDTPVRWTELYDKLANNAKLQREGELYVEADKDLPYGVVMVAMSIAREAGAAKLQMVADPNAAKAPLDEWDAQRAEANAAGRGASNPSTP